MTHDKYESLRSFFEKYGMKFSKINEFYEATIPMITIEAVFVPIYHEVLVAGIPIKSEVPEKIITNKEYVLFVEEIAKDIKQIQGLSLEVLVR